MDTRVALIGIILEDEDSVKPLNDLLHEYGKYIIGRMGLPYRAKDVNIINVMLDAPESVAKELSEKIDKLHGVNAKTVYSNAGK